MEKHEMNRPLTPLGKYGIEPFDADPRSRFYLRPKRVVATSGDISGAERMLLDKPGQVSFDSSGCCVMKKGSMMLLDLGREIHGSVRILTQWTKPERVTLNIRFGESVTEALTPVPGRGSTNDHANRDFRLTVSSWSGTDTNESGFRFVCIEMTDGEEIGIKAVEGVLIIRDIEYRGSFECSDPVVTEIYNTAAYTAHLNMQEYMWDGIKRDRLVWIGDMHPEVMTICSVFGYNDVVPRSLDSVRDVTPIFPEDDTEGKRVLWMNGFPSYTIWWLMCQRDWFMQNGDIDYLNGQKKYMLGLVDLFSRYVSEDGQEHLPDARFLDWPNANDPVAIHCGLQGLLATAFDTLAYFCRIFGEEEKAELCDRTAKLLRSHVPEMKSKSASALLALSGIADPKTVDETMLSPGGAHGWSTFYSYYIMAAKAMAGNTKGAIDGMREYYGTMLKLGATTFWEDFNLDWATDNDGNLISHRIDEVVPEGERDIHADFGAYCYKGLRHSLCHGWSSGPCTFIARHIMGISILEPGCRKIRIAPNLGGLEWFRGTYPTPYGNICVEKHGDNVRIEAPEEIEIVK